MANYVTPANLEQGLSEIWNAMKRYVYDHTVDADLRPVIMSRLSTLINRTGASWQSILEQVQYLEEFKSELQEVCEGAGIYVGNLELINWISMIRVATGILGTMIYATDEDGMDHFYTASEWNALKAQAEQGVITLPDCHGVIISTSTASVVVAVTTYPALAWGGYGITLTMPATSDYAGYDNTRYMLQNLNPLVSKHYYDDPEVIVVEDYNEIDTATAPSGNTWYVVVTSQGEGTVTKVHTVKKTTADGYYYMPAEGSDIGSTQELYTAQAYYWNGNSLTSKYQVPYQDSRSIVGSPAAEFCARYKAFNGDESPWWLGKQSELAIPCANNAKFTECATAINPAFVLSGSVWSSVQINYSNAYYTSFPSGGQSYTDKNGSYYAVPFSAFRRGVA